MKFFAFFLLPLAAFATSNDENFPNRDQVFQAMQEIYVAMAKGQAPALKSEVQYFQGSCLTSWSSVKKPQNYSAVVALAATEEGIYSITYSTITGGNTPSFGRDDLAKLGKLYTPKAKPYQVVKNDLGGEIVEFTIAEATPSFPKIMAYLSVEKENPNRMNFVAALMGFYCQLDRVQ
jgi:hypothetical protein